MDIETYAKIAPQYYITDLPILLKKYLEKTSYASLLDCGCGDGALLYALKRNAFLKGKNVYAIDLSKNRIALVKKIDRNIHASVDNAESLETIKRKHIDFFISEQVIEHVNDKKMVAAIERVLKKNAICYITTVFKKSFGWYFYRNNGKWVIDPTHVREYTEDKQLLALFKKNFQILETQKTLHWFPLSDYVVKRIRIANRKFYESNFFRIIRKIKVPIPGYYNWEIVLKKK